MNEKNEDPFGMASVVNSWIKSMDDFWVNMAGQGTATKKEKQSETGEPGNKTGNPKAQEALEAALKNWNSMSSAMMTPESMAALMKGSGAIPEMLFQLAQTSQSSFYEMQQKMVERLGRLSSTSEAYDFQDIEQNIFRTWTDTYEKEFKQFLQIPQLGLMRTYQEKANQLADKYNLLQSTVSEFLCLLGLPFNRSMQVMQDKIGEMAENGSLPEDSKVYYDMWVKVLEGHFMTLFQTPAYSETLARTINSLADFSAARDSALEDLLNLLPVAKRSDFDDMARELYEVKKRIRKIEREQKK